MIDSNFENLCPLARRPAACPVAGVGREVHVSTIYRWATAGCRGVVLETLQVGGTRCTSAEALRAVLRGLDSRSEAYDGRQRLHRDDAYLRLPDAQLGGGRAVAGEVRG